MSLRIPIPAKENQKKISCLLDSIEDKISIETNMLKHDIRQKTICFGKCLYEHLVK